MAILPYGGRAEVAARASRHHFVGGNPARRAAARYLTQCARPCQKTGEYDRGRRARCHLRGGHGARHEGSAFLGVYGSIAIRPLNHSPLNVGYHIRASPSSRSCRRCGTPPPFARLRPRATLRDHRASRIVSIYRIAPATIEVLAIDSAQIRPSVTVRPLAADRRAASRMRTTVTLFASDARSVSATRIDPRTTAARYCHSF